jgi:quercetin dioxygenase-like cupin family protein
MMQATPCNPIVPSSVEDADALPWVQLAPGFCFKVLRAMSDDETWVELLRLQPGTVIPRHRHTGEVHAYTLAGHRELIETGTIVGPGSYVFEPAGTIDSWRAVGNQPLIMVVGVRGAIEYLDDAGAVIRRSTATTAAERYRRGCL